jgi:hypothetical protein
MILLSAATALAGGCCAPASSAVPDVLGPRETVGIGLQIAGGPTLAHWTWDGRLVPADHAEGSVTATFVGLGRLSRRVQLGVSAPVQGGWAVRSAKVDLGGGPGDLSVGVRWDAEPVHCGEWHLGARPSLSAGISVPTGRSWEQVGADDGVDVTGVGVFQPSVGATWEGSHPHGSFSASIAARWPVGQPVTGGVGAAASWQLGDLWLRGSAGFELGGPAASLAMQPRAGLGVLWDVSESARATLGVDTAVPVPGGGRSRAVDPRVTASILATLPR